MGAYEADSLPQGINATIKVADVSRLRCRGCACCLFRVHILKLTHQLPLDIARETINLPLNEYKLSVSAGLSHTGE